MTGPPVQNADREAEGLMAEMLKAGAPSAEVEAWYNKHYGAAKPGGQFADVKGGATGAVEKPETLGGRASRAWKSMFSDETFENAARHTLNAAQGLPGMEAFQAGAGALGSKFTDHPMTYRQSLETLRGETEKIPETLRLVEKMAGGAALVPTSLPGALAGRGSAALARVPAVAKAAAGGAAFGGIDPLVQADPDKGVGERLQEAGKGAAVGAVVGTGAHAATDAAKTLGGVVRQYLPRAVGGSPSLGRIATDMATQRGAAADKAYGDAIAAARARMAQPNYHVPGELRELLQSDDFAPIVQRLSERRSLRGMDPTDPRFLDEVYKDLAEASTAAGKSLEAVDPRRGNTARGIKRDVDDMKEALLGAMDAPGKITATFETSGAPKPSLREGIKNFEENKVRAFKRKEGTIEQQRTRMALEERSARGGLARQEPLSENVYAIGGGKTRVANDAAPYMDEYRGAVGGFADAMKEKRAFSRGLDAMRSASRQGVPTERELSRSTPEAMAEWVKGASQAEKRRALQAVMGSALPAAGASLQSPSAALLSGAGFLLGGPTGALAGAGVRVLPAAARAHYLRMLLDPLSQSATIRALLAAENVQRTVSRR